MKVTKHGVGLYLAWQQAVYNDSTDIADLPPEVWIKRLERFAGQVSCYVLFQ